MKKLSPELRNEIAEAIKEPKRLLPTQPTSATQILPGDGMQCGVTNSVAAFSMPRKNFFLGRWIRYGGFYPDRKVRLVRREEARFEDRAVHEDMKIGGKVAALDAPLLHHAYPTLTNYIEHMNRYSSLGAEMAVAQGKRGFSFFNIVVRPWSTFVYNYVFRGWISGRARRIAPASLPRCICELEIREGLGEIARDLVASSDSAGGGCFGRFVFLCANHGFMFLDQHRRYRLFDIFRRAQPLDQFKIGFRNFNGIYRLAA